MTKKVIFFDIDGTLLDHDKLLPKTAYDAVMALKDKGHYIAIATGRAAFAFEDLRQQLGIETYVSLNGQYVVHEGEVVYKNPLNYEGIKQLEQLSLEKKHPLVYLDAAGWQTNTQANPYVETAINSLKIDAPLVYDPQAYHKTDTYQALLFCEANEEKPYEKALEPFDFVRWHDYSVDVLPKGGSKAIGIKKLMEYLQVADEHTYAFGDGLNDREMLQMIPNSVAMGNAREEVKTISKYVTTDVAEDGILNGIKLAGLL